MKKVLSRSLLILLLSFLSIHAVLFAAASGQPIPNRRARDGDWYGMAIDPYFRGRGRYNKDPLFMTYEKRVRLSQMLDAEQAAIDAMDPRLGTGELNPSIKLRQDQVDAARKRLNMHSLQYACTVGLERVYESFAEGVAISVEDNIGKKLGSLIQQIFEYVQTYLSPKYFYRRYLCGRPGPFKVNVLKAHNIYVLSLLVKLSGQVTKAASVSNRPKVKRHVDLPGETVLEEKDWQEESEDLAEGLDYVADDIEKSMRYYDENAESDVHVIRYAHEVVKWIRRGAKLIRSAENDIDLASSNNQNSMTRCIHMITDGCIRLKNALTGDTSEKFVNVAGPKTTYNSGLNGYGGGGMYGSPSAR